jgi:hypothetical protein
MEQEIHDYWQQRLNAEVGAREELCGHLRGEVERLQGRCHELASINSMGRAAVATDVRNFAVENSAMTPNGVAAVPLESLVDFLHAYTNGLVPQLPREQKRGRARDDEEYGQQQQHWAPQATASPVTPTVAQLLAQRNGHAQPPQAASQQQQQQQAAAAEQPSMVPEQAPPVAPSRCAQQHLADRKRRDRGAAMEDEAGQVRPWLFSVAP